MCGPVTSLSLLVLIVGMTFSWTQGQVTAPANLIVEVGQPLLLSCNITILAGNTVQQVRWLDKHNNILLAYVTSDPIRISHQDPNVQLTASQSDASHITINKVQSGGGGCYRCVFDVYPIGAQEGKTCITVLGKVYTEGNVKAVSAEQATLSCWYSLPDEVMQVIWRKTADRGAPTVVASYSKGDHMSIANEFIDRVSISRSLGETQLTFQSVRIQDEACYTCDFNTYPDGTKRARACLSVYVLPKPEVTYVTSSSGVIKANCTTQSRPEAEITWNIERDSRALGPPILSFYKQGDGTTIVTSTLLFQSVLLSDLTVKCIVQHQGLKEPLTVSLNTNGKEGVGSTMVILLSVFAVVAILLLCLCLCKYFIHTNESTNFSALDFRMGFFHVPVRMRTGGATPS